MPTDDAQLAVSEMLPDEAPTNAERVNEFGGGDHLETGLGE